MKKVREIFQSWLSETDESEREKYFNEQIVPLLFNYPGSRVDWKSLYYINSYQGFVHWLTEQVHDSLPVDKCLVSFSECILDDRLRLLALSGTQELVELLSKQIFSDFIDLSFLLNSDVKEQIKKNELIFLHDLRQVLLNLYRPEIDHLLKEISLSYMYGFGFVDEKNILGTLVIFVPRILNALEIHRLNSFLKFLNALFLFFQRYLYLTHVYHDLELLLNQNKQCIVLFDENGKWIVGNQVAIEIFLGQVDLFDSKTLDILGLTLLDVENLKNGKHFFFSTYHLKNLKNTHLRNMVYGYIKPHFKTPHQVSSYLMYFLPSDESENIKKSIAAIEERYQRIFYYMQDVYFEVDWDGNIIELSPSVGKVIGKPREELIGKNMLEFYNDPLEREKYLQLLSVQGSVQNYLLELKSNEGEIFYVSVNSKVIQNSDGKKIIVGSLRNVTSEELNKRELHEAQQKFRTIFEEVPVGLCLLGLDGQVIEINETLVKMLGSPSKEMSKQLNIFKVTPERTTELKKAIERVHQTGQTMTAEINYRSYWGKELYARVQIKPFYFTGFDVPTVLLLVEDLTDYQHIKKEQATLQTRFNELFNKTKDFVLLLNEKWEIVSANEVFVQWSGLSLSQVNKQSIHAFFSFGDVERMKKLLIHSHQNLVLTLEMTNLRNEKRWVELSLTPLPDKDNQQEIFILGRDVTERMHQSILLEKTLQEKERLILELHHRLKNIFQIILSLLNHYDRYFKSTSMPQDYFDLLKKKIFIMAIAYTEFYFKDFQLNIPIHQFIDLLALTSQMTNFHLVKDNNQTNFQINIDKAIPLGLAINCLYNMAEKYHNDKEFQINVKLHESQCEISFSNCAFPLSILKQYPFEAEFLKMMVTHALNGRLTIDQDRCLILY
ncbi:MAG: PAS domain S-box protein [Bacteroidales bacterium]|nr:PAS domain S-box protein [Bacteroidales bacterium]